MTNTELEQRKLCETYDAEYYPSLPFQKLGISDNIGSDKLPINGLRHLPSRGTCGWYIWRGEELGQDDGFFQPIHVLHLEDELPGVMKFLALPPGWRFLVAPGHQDVWYDLSLLVE